CRKASVWTFHDHPSASGLLGLRLCMRPINKFLADHCLIICAGEYHFDHCCIKGKDGSDESDCQSASCAFAFFGFSALPDCCMFTCCPPSATILSYYGLMILTFISQPLTAARH